MGPDHIEQLVRGEWGLRAREELLKVGPDTSSGDLVHLEEPGDLADYALVLLHTSHRSHLMSDFPPVGSDRGVCQRGSSLSGGGCESAPAGAGAGAEAGAEAGITGD